MVTPPFHPSRILTAASRDSSEGARWNIEPTDKVGKPSHRNQDWQEAENQDWQEAKQLFPIHVHPIDHGNVISPQETMERPQK